MVIIFSIKGLKLEMVACCKIVGYIKKNALRLLAIQKKNALKLVAIKKKCYKIVDYSKRYAFRLLAVKKKCFNPLWYAVTFMLRLKRTACRPHIRSDKLLWIRFV